MTTMNDLLRASTERFRDRLCIRDGDTLLTYGEFFDQASRFASTLRARGVATGDRVLISMPNSWRGLVAIAGTMLSGGVVAPTNVTAKRRELVHWVNLVKPAVVVAASGPLAELASGEGTSGFGFLKELVDGDNGGAGGIDFDAAIAAGDPGLGAFPELDDATFIMFTSGTTGFSKGVTRSHRAYVGFMEWWGRMMVRPSEVVLSFLPLNHQAGSLLSCLTPMSQGSEIVLIPRFDPEHFWKACIDHKVNWALTMPPTPGLLAKADARPSRPHSLRETMGGGSPADWTAYEETFGVGLYTGYGQTESTMVTMSATARAAGDRLWPKEGGYCGPSVPGWIDMRIAADEGDGQADAGEPGEIQLHGGGLFSEYWNDPAATMKAFTPDGWFRTGDLGYITDLGDLYFLRRTGDRIRRSGENIDPIELEDVLKEHPDITDAGVVGIADERRGEEVLACVVVRAGASLTFAEVTAYCSAHMANFKVPRFLEFRETLPKTDGTFRIQRNVLREQADPTTWFDRYADR